MYVFSEAGPVCVCVCSVKRDLFVCVFSEAGPVCACVQ